MNDSSSRIKITAYVIAAFFFVSLFVAAHYITLNRQAVSSLDEEKLKSEALLSEKLLLQKEIERIRKEISAFEGKNSNLDILLSEANAEVAEKEAQLHQIKRTNSALAELNRQLAELKAVRADLNTQVASLNGELARLSDENTTLKKENASANAMIAHLEKENKSLSQDLSLLTTLADDNLVVVTKKNEKLTVRSRQARQIKFTFDVPQSSLGGLEFRIVSPTSKVYSKADGSISHHLVASEGNPVASLGNQPAQFELVQRVEMMFTPKEKLSKGLYKIEVFNHGTHLGRMQVQLQ